jgi:chromosome partitioning protein
MGKIICIANQKGGVAKTTTCVNLATVLAGYKTKPKVAVVDLDSQGDASASFGIDPDEVEKTIFSVFLKECTMNQIKITKYGVDVFPANDDLAGLDILVMENSDEFPDHHFVVKAVLDQVRDIYDYIFIDLPPSLNFTTINALSAADEVVIPMQLEFLAARGMQKLLNTIDKVRENTNPNLKIRGIIGVMYMAGTNLSSVVLQQARQFCEKTGITIYETVINRSVRIGESPMFGSPAVIYNPKNQAAQDYIKLTKEMFS